MPPFGQQWPMRPSAIGRERTMTTTLPHRADRLRVHDVDLEVVRRGSGRPLLFLHGFHPLDANARLLELLARRARVMAPSHPGFGQSSRPDDFETVYDLVHFYCELIDGFAEDAGDTVTLVGTSFGGWLAAEIAALCPHRL